MRNSSRNPCVWTSLCGILYLWTEDLRCQHPSTSVDHERKSFGTSSCRSPAGLPTDAPQKVSWFVRLRSVGSETSRLVEMDARRVSVFSSLGRAFKCVGYGSWHLYSRLLNKLGCVLLERSSAMSLFATGL